MTDIAVIKKECKKHYEPSKAWYCGGKGCLFYNECPMLTLPKDWNKLKTNAIIKRLRKGEI